MSKFFNELKRRNVIKAAIAYLVVAWVLLQVATILLDTFHSPDWVKQAFTLFLVIGLPIWIIISWIYDFTPKGIEKTPEDSETQVISQITSKRLNIFIIVSLVIAVIILTIKPSFFSYDPDSQFTIAVLPFNNLNSDINKEWYSDAVTSDIHTKLSHIENFHIISLQTVGRYKGTSKTTPEIAKELGVSFIVNGNMRQLNNRIVITAYLIDVSSDKQIWADKYDEILDDALTIHQEVSKKIVEQLKINISPDDARVLDIVPTKNQKAYEYFKKGKALADKRSAENRILNESIEFFKKAIALDSTYADAYAEMALLKYLTSSSSPEEIKYLNEKALEIEPNTARVYSTRGLIHTQNGNLKDAKVNFEKAISINPNDATARHHFALYFGYLPEIDNKNRLIQIREAHKINPYSSPINNVYLYALLDEDRIQEAEELLNKINYVYPDIGFSVIAKEEFKGLINSYKEKDFTEIIKNMIRAKEEKPNNPQLTAYLGSMYNNVLNDDANYLAYSKEAFESESTNGNLYFSYYRSLLENKKFVEAKRILNNNVFARSRYYLATDSLEKALEIINKTNHGITIEIKLKVFAKMAETDSINQIFKNNEVYDSQKAYVYAILKNKDSMYHYLNRCTKEEALYDINGYNVFNPYRKEERFKAFLKKNYLPLTHWNE